MAGRKRSRPIWPIFLMVLGVSLIAGAAFWYANNSSSPSLAAPTQTTAPVNLIPYPTIPRVSVEDAKEAFDNGSAVFVDVRGDPFYGEGHIPGALNLSEDDFSGHLGELNKSDWIITYCT